MLAFTTFAALLATASRDVRILVTRFCFPGLPAIGRFVGMAEKAGEFL